MNRSGVALASGVVTALVSGVAEYIMSGGASTWIPLLAGLVGAFGGWTVSYFAFSSEREGQPRRTAPELIDMIREDLTSIEANNLIKPHIGSKIKAHGTVIDVKESMSMYPFLSNFSVFFRIDDDHTAFAHFSPLYTSKMRRLRKGDCVSVIGRVQGVETRYITLGSARLLDSGRVVQ